MERVLLIGSGGSGKTTLARRVAAAAALPLFHLDRLYWRPGWQPTPPDVWELTVSRVLAGDRWVIDGNYGGTLALRLAAADTAIFLDVPRSVCLARVLRRGLGRPREEVAPGCPQRLTWPFVRWVWGYPRTRRPRVLAQLEEFERRGGRVVVLRAGEEIEAFVGSIRRRAATRA